MNAQIGIIMGSKSDWDTMRHASDTLESLGVAHDVQVVSAHRTPDLLYEYAESAVGRGLKVIIAGAGGAAHLPGMIAAKTRLPVLGVPVESKALNGMDSLALDCTDAGWCSRRVHGDWQSWSDQCRITCRCNSRDD